MEPKGRGVALQSLPQPWLKVAEFVKQYLTCEGWYQVIYQHDFVLINHLRHGQLINMPYYLLGCLKNMSRYIVNAKNPLLSLKHHRLAQLLIDRGFALNNLPPLTNPLQQREENPQPEEEIPQQEEEIPHQEQEIPHQEEEIPHQEEEIPHKSRKFLIKRRKFLTKLRTYLSRMRKFLSKQRIFENKYPRKALRKHKTLPSKHNKYPKFPRKLKKLPQKSLKIYNQQ